MVDLTQIARAIICLAVSVISAFLIPYIKKKTNSETYTHLQFWATVGVEAAEMIFKESGMGAEKKRYVISFLESKGFSIDEVSINNVIEAAVNELKQNIAQ